MGSVTTYDTSEKQRTPSWTDRILWLTKEEKAVRQLSLKPHPKYVASDHKPLSSLFEVECLRINEVKRLEIRLAVLKELDAFENDGAIWFLMPSDSDEPV